MIQLDVEDLKTDGTRRKRIRSQAGYGSCREGPMVDMRLVLRELLDEVHVSPLRSPRWCDAGGCCWYANV